jgi:Protein of unknown function (DUF3037)
MSPASPAASYSYAIVRLVPRVERDEFLNVGVILFVRASRTLCALIGINPERIRQLDPDADICAINAHLELFRSVCDAAPGAGPIGDLPADERFHWLTAPRSTVIQMSAVHEGRTPDIEATLSDLFDRYVARSHEGT